MQNRAGAAFATSHAWPTATLFRVPAPANSTRGNKIAESVRHSTAGVLVEGDLRGYDPAQLDAWLLLILGGRVF